jgi:peptidyl-prolyl cis-trans isomerase SurA
LVRQWMSGSIVVALALIAAPLAAQRLDGIAAVVNDEVVLQSDVEEQLYLFMMRAQAEPDSTVADTLRRQILNQLIDEKLIVAEAKRQAVTVPDVEVNKQVDQAVREAKERMGSAEAFQAQLAKENLTEAKLRDKYKAEVRRQMLAQRLVQKQIARKTVSQAEAEAYFKAHPEKFPQLPGEVHVAVIQIPVTPDSARDLKARAEANRIRQRLVGGEKFAKVAAEVSDDPGSARSGGDLGYFIRGQMDPEIEDAAFSQKIGVVSAPIRSSFGYHLLEVLDRDTLKTAARKDSLDDQGRPVVEAHARHILVRVEISDADVERARKKADRVRAEAAKGGDFAQLVSRYSEYKGPASAGGDLGFLSLGSLQPNIRGALDSLAVGQISRVLVNRAGFNIFKMIAKKPERPYTLDEIKGELPQAVATIQYREKYDAWVKGLRAKAHIEYRSS